jgi:hypothetical protein
MNNIFIDFSSRGYKYSYKNSPITIRTEEKAFDQGLNCITLIHLLLKKLFTIELPNNILPWEMFCDNPYFTDVKSIKKIKTGDIFFFGRKELPEFTLTYIPKYDSKKNLLNADEGKRLIGDKYTGIHLAMFTGDFDKDGDPLLIHAGKIDMAVSIWSLKKFLSYEQYAVLHKTKRPVLKN